MGFKDFLNRSHSREDETSEQVPELTDDEKKAQAEKEAQETSSKIDEALNDPGFTAFLEKAVDNFENFDVSDNNSAEILDKYEVFKQVGKVSNEIKKVLSEQIKIDTRLSLSNEDLRCVGEYIEEQAIDRGPGGTEYLVGLLEKVAQYNHSKENVKNIDASISTLVGNYDARKQAFDKVKGMGGWNRKTANFLNKITFGRAKQEQVADLQEGMEQGIDPNKLRQAEKELEDQSSNIDQLKKMQADFNNARDSLMGEIALGSSLMSRVQEIIKEKLVSTKDKKDVSLLELDRAQEHYDSLIEDYRGQIPEDWQSNMDALIREKIVDEAREAVKGVSTEKKGQLNNMENRLNLLFRRRETGVGSSKTQEEINQFIGEALADIVNGGGVDTLKRKLIERICHKNGIDLDNFRYNSARAEATGADDSEDSEDEIDIELGELKDDEGRMDIDEAREDAQKVADLARREGDVTASSEAYQAANTLIDSKKISENIDMRTETAAQETEIPRTQEESKPVRGAEEDLADVIPDSAKRQQPEYKTPQETDQEQEFINVD